MKLTWTACFVADIGGGVSLVTGVEGDTGQGGVLEYLRVEPRTPESQLTELFHTVQLRVLLNSLDYGGTALCLCHSKNNC